MRSVRAIRATVALHVLRWHYAALEGARERDVVGNTIPEDMAEAEMRLEQLSEATIRGVREKIG